MSKVLSFKVEIKGLEDKIWRKIEIENSHTLADLAYLIMATFELYSNEFFTITYGSDRYDSANTMYNNEEFKSVIGIKLEDLSFDVAKKMILEYDYEYKIEFIIKFLGSKKIGKDSNDYLRIGDGAGRGTLSYVSGEELKQIVDETDKLGESNYFITVVVEDKEEEEIFDYRDFDLDDNNFAALYNFSFIKEEYESRTLIDVLRIMKENGVLYYKTDIRSIVNPFDYMKKYIPDNYHKLSNDERSKLNIPEYEDLNIYRLPTYEEINHKEIMTLYVKKNIENKGIRQELFYALRNYVYKDKFYNILRKYGLFKHYLDYSHYYYEQIIKDWRIKNNINH